MSSEKTGLRKRAKPEKKYFARRLRKNPTKSEKILWSELRNRKMGVRFRRQAIILGWIVDFWCPAKDLVIEVDGSVHETRRVEDSRRDAVLLAERGIRTLRIKSHRVFSDLPEVLDEIRSEVSK